MTINEYQEKAQRTSSTKTPTHKLTNACLGLAGETGEVCDLLKKALFQGHELDADKLIEEAGDCAWYLAELAAALDVSLETILDRNIAKLKSVILTALTRSAAGTGRTRIRRNASK